MRAATHRLQPIARLRMEIDRLAVFVAATAFSLAAIAFRAGELDVPGGWLALVTFPVALAAVNLLNPRNLLAREIWMAVTWAGILLVALWAYPIILALPVPAAGLPFALGFAALCARYPAAAMIAMLILVGTVGSFRAYIGFSPSLLIDLLIGSLAIIVAIRVVIGRPHTFRVWPAILAIGLYVLISIVDLATAQNPQVAWLGFHTTIVYMLVMLGLAYVGWDRSVYRRILLGFVGLTVLVSGYAVLRWVIGPSGAERELAETVSRDLNVDPIYGHLKTVGSFLTAHELTLWTAMMAPLCAGYMLWAKGPSRMLAGVGLGLAILAAFASEGRGPLVGLVVGLGLILGLYQAARAFPGFKVGVIALVAAGLLGLGGAGIALSDNPQSLERYTRILNPGEDPTYSQRVNKWGAVWDEVEEHPFGQGLGAGGQAQRQAGEFLNAAQVDLDNSYLKIAFEQGLAVAALFAIAMLMLLGTLAVASVRTRSKEAAAIGIGGCGTLAALLVSLWAGVYIESIVVLSGWMVVGVALSYFVAKPAEPAEEPPRVDGPSALRFRAAAAAARAHAESRS